MKTISLCLVFLCALPAFGESAGTNFLAKIYNLNDRLPEAAPGTVAMQPFKVSAERVDPDTSSKETDRLFRYFHPTTDDNGENATSEFPLSFERNETALESVVESFTALSRDIAVRFRGGVVISPRVTLYFKGGLFWRLSEKYSIGLRSFDFGVKGLVLRILW